MLTATDYCPSASTISYLTYCGGGVEFGSSVKTQDFSFYFFVSQYRKFLLGNNSVYQKILGIENFFSMEKGISRFSVEIFFVSLPKNFVRETFCVSKNSVWKISIFRREGIMVLSRTFCLTGPKNFVRGPFCVSEIEKNYEKEMGVSRFSVEDFLSHSAEKFRRGALLCFKNFWYRKLWCIAGGIMVLSKYFCLRGPKNFVRGPFCVSEFFWCRKKILGKRYGGYHDFPSKTFRFTVPKTFVGEPFNV